MEDAFEEGYFPPDLMLGMETGWTLTEIRELSPILKKMYLKFIELQKKKEQEQVDKMKRDIDSKTGTSSSEEVITFVNEEDYENDFYSRV